MNNQKKAVEIVDCTLRDGGHALENSFSVNAAAEIVEALLGAGIPVIELGRPSGLGSPKGSVSDEDYLIAVQPFMERGELGMFCLPDCFGTEQIELLRTYRLGFLRVGTGAGTVEPSEAVIGKIRDLGIKVRYSLVQAHTVAPGQLAENARKVAGYGAQSITIMDSTGTMVPAQVKQYVTSLTAAVDVPIGFHGHNNLGLSVANAMAAIEAGASSVDGALGGLARSAGNAPTEMLCAVMEKLGIQTGVDFFGLLGFIDSRMAELAPDVYHVPPVDIIFGYAGFHSRNLGLARAVAETEGVDLYRLITEVMRYGQANPQRTLFERAAAALKV